MGFIVSKKLVEVELEYCEVGDTDILVLSGDEHKEFFKGKTKKVTAKFQRPRYGSYNNYMNGCMKTNAETGISEFDEMRFKSNKFNALLVELVDNDGEKVVLDRAFYSDVNPDFAIGLIDAFDAKLQKDKIDFLTKEGFFKKEEAEKEPEKKEDVKD